MAVVISHPGCGAHRPGIGHPESPARLRAALAGVPAGMAVITPEPAEPIDLELVHERAYIESIGAKSAAGMVIRTDPDTVLSPGTWPAALYAVGAMRLAVKKVMSDDVRRAFCLVRPPGHHAGKSATKGFCFFNTLAIGARILQREYGLRRIAVIDWDAHHGNGTQDAFYAEQGVYYVSLHQYPWFPGTGRRSERGIGPGRGYNLNIPLAAGATDGDIMEVFRDEIDPVMLAYRPEIILISAGFDGHVGDPLAAWMLTECGYEFMTRCVLDWADRFCAGRVVSLLEGGYSAPALTACVGAHLSVLAGFENAPGSISGG